MNQKPELRCVKGTEATASGSGAAVAMNSTKAQATTGLPSVLMKARRAALEELHQLLGDVFDKADDTFFEYAGKAGSDQEKDAYLETMRQLRLNRKEIERNFYQKLNILFKRLPHTGEGNGVTLEAISSPQGLSLVADEDLEMNVALESMATKAKNKFADKLYQLNTRMEAVLAHSRVKVNEKNNPFHPQQVCEAFNAASQVVDCDIKKRLVFYKLFDKFVIADYDLVLDTANAVLADAGVLPDLKGTPRLAAIRRRSSDSDSRSGSTDPRGNETQSAAKQAANEFFGQLQMLLASVRNVPTVTDVVTGPIGSTASDAREMSSSELFELLSRLQQVQPQADDLPQGRVSLPKVNVRGVVTNLLRQRESQQGPERVGQNDTDVINLVSMLFEFILDDENLPIPVKALIGRLQIPYLKLAIQDYGFFSRNGHPARKLLNELARAGIGLTEDPDLLQKDVVFKKVQSTVQRILAEYEKDAGLFEELLREFGQFMQTEVRRAQMIEQRTRAAEEGKAKVQLAEKTALETVRQRLDGKTVPEVAVRLLTDGWMSVLKLVFLKYGPESNNWLGAVKTIDHLLLSVTPVADDAARKRLFNIVPILLKNLRQGLNSVSFNPFEMGEMLTELEQLQMQVLRGDTPEQVNGHGGDPAKDLVAAVTEDMERMGASPVAPSQRKVTPLDVTRKVAEPEVTLPPLADDDPYLAQAKKVGVGTWMEFRTGDDVRTRCKLAAHIKSADKMIFVNRTGVKIDEKTTLGLAHALKNGDVVILEDSQLFDRALQNVIGNLRKVKQANL
ncbi:MAG: thymidine phosphorylase [Pseudomonadales bacterium]|mgnify:CR=1 FL=1|nr:thymidine phosphorylase [Pseudomonadales bacterium]